MDKFILHSNYKPTGDQPQAIEKLVDGIEKGYKEQTLLGVTGSGRQIGRYDGGYIYDMQGGFGSSGSTGGSGVPPPPPPPP